MGFSDWVSRTFYGPREKDVTRDGVSVGNPSPYLGDLPTDEEERRRVLIERYEEQRRRGRGVRIADGADSGMFPDG
jgi:hypothetical protein